MQWQQLLLQAEEEKWVAILHKCRQKKDLREARRLLAHLRLHRLDSHPVLGNCLVSTLAQCGSLPDARRVFDGLSHPDEHSWTSLISSYTHTGHPETAFGLYHQMQQHSHAQPSHMTYLALLKACITLRDSPAGHTLHADIIRHGMEGQLFACSPLVGNSLVDMYGKLGSLAEAHHVFDNLPFRDAISWTALITGYSEHGFGEEVLTCFKLMQEGGVSADAITYVLCLKACSSVGSLDTGREIHDEVAQKGLESELYVGNKLVDMYGRSGLLAEAHSVFDMLPVHDVISWNAYISGYAELGLGEEVLNSYNQMQLEGFFADAVTFGFCLRACVATKALETGQAIHTEITFVGVDRELHLGSALVSMYGRCGALPEAQQVFGKLSAHDAISWTALIAGYDLHGRGENVLDCFNRMQLDGVHADSVTFVLCLKGCATTGSLETGRKIHNEIRRAGLEKDPYVGNMLIEMYSQCGSVAEGREVFDKLPAKGVGSWTAMIKAYGENHEGNMAVQCFEEMLEHGVMPDSVTFTCLLTACSHASLVHKGQEYFQVMREQYEIEPTCDHYACMVDLLARSGRVYEAEKFVAALHCPPSSEVLTALLNACKTYGEVEMGEWYLQQLLEANQEDAAAYLLMADIYSTACRWRDADKIEEMRITLGAKKKAGNTSIEVNLELQEFVVGASQSEIVLGLLELISPGMKHEGYVPNLDLISGRMLD